MKILEAYVEQLLEFESEAAFEKWFARRQQISPTVMELVATETMPDSSFRVRLRKSYNSSPMHFEKENET